jgi:hypothetical protein
MDYEEIIAALNSAREAIEANGSGFDLDQVMQIRSAVGRVRMAIDPFMHTAEHKNKY